MNNCLIQENGTDSDCSSLFESIHPAYTIIQACIAMTIIVIGMPLNLVLIASLIKFRHLMDEAFILCVSIFTANFVVSLALGSTSFLSSITRSWPLGYAGCQVFGFLVYWAVVARWITLGMLSIDRFCRVFFPFWYTRHSKKVLMTLLIGPWVVMMLSNILTLIGLSGRFGFHLYISPRMLPSIQLPRIHCMHYYIPISMSFQAHQPIFSTLWGKTYLFWQAKVTSVANSHFLTSALSKARHSILCAPSFTNHRFLALAFSEARHSILRTLSFVNRYFLASASLRQDILSLSSFHILK